MTVAGLALTQNASTLEDVTAHLEACGDDFVSPLRRRVDVNVYARKLIIAAVRFEAWKLPSLVALVAAYPSDPAAGDAVFITNVSVLPDYRRIGVASGLVWECVSWATEHRASCVELDVDARAWAAVALYEGLGFAAASADGSTIRMRLEVGR
jgi:ribosomal protein S18 acetylase RimI-like enzyme